MQTMACLPLSSRSARWCLAVLALGCGLAAAPSAAVAQGFPRTAEELKKKKDAEMEGTVQQASASGVTLLSATNDQYFIGVAPDPSISHVMVSGTADPSWLGSGVFIRFQGTVEAKDARTYALKDPVGSVELYSYDARLISEDPVVGEDSTIQGKLLKVKEGVFDIQLFGKKIKKVSGVFTAAPEIKVSLTDLSVVKSGDRIKLKGKVLDEKKANFILGTDLTVTLTEPLKGKRKWVPPAAAPAGEPKTEEKKEDKKEEEKKAA